MPPTNNKRIAKNTIILYIRMLFTMAVSLYTSRVVLITLGIEDFGIYNVVAGVVIMFGFLNNAMAASTERFLTFELGKNDSIKLNRIFSISVTLHVLIAIIVFVLSETIGVWFLNTRLNIPHGRLSAANWVLQFSIFTSIITILSVPYNATIISHERMNIFAYMSILEVTLKLLIVYILQLFGYDKLVFYSILTFFVYLLLRIIYGIYCSRTFEESHYRFFWDKKLFFEMSGFAGWNLLGVFAGIGYNQGVNILLNIFFGPVINAARGIAFQVMGAINQLVTNFQTAVNPPIIKSFATKEEKNTNQLVFASSKFTFFLLLLFVVPLLIESKFVLQIWLKKVPEYSILFTRLVLVDVLICSLSGPLHILVQATGKIRNYQLLVSTILLLNLPMSYIFLKVGYPPQSTFVISILLSICALCARLIILNKLINFSAVDFFKSVLLKVMFVTILTIPIPFFIYKITTEGLPQFFFVGTTTVILLLLLVWFVGLSASEHQYAKVFILRQLKKA